MHFIPVGTETEIADKASWINGSYTVDAGVYRAMCAAIGDAIAAWALVELQLMTIYMQLHKTEPAKKTSDEFQAERGFKGKLKMVNGSIYAASLDPGLVADWRRMHARIQPLADTRHFIAHKPMNYEHTQPDERKFYLCYWRWEEPERGRLYLADIVAATEAFDQLSQDLSDLFGRIAFPARQSP